VKRLHPVERACRIRQFARTVIEFALAASNAAEVEAQRCETALLEHVEQIIDDLVVHRSAELRMWMKDERDRSILFFGRLIATFEASGRTVENDFWHVYSARNGKAGSGRRNLTSLDAASRTGLKFRQTESEFQFLWGLNRLFLIENSRKLRFQNFV